MLPAIAGVDAGGAIPSPVVKTEDTADDTACAPNNGGPTAPVSPETKARDPRSTLQTNARRQELSLHRIVPRRADTPTTPNSDAPIAARRSLAVLLPPMTWTTTRRPRRRSRSTPSAHASTLPLRSLPLRSLPHRFTEASESLSSTSPSRRRTRRTTTFRRHSGRHFSTTSRRPPKRRSATCAQCPAGRRTCCRP